MKKVKNKFYSMCLCPGSIMVEQLTHNPQIKGSKPAREKTSVEKFYGTWLYPGSTVVEQLPHNPWMKGSEPAREKTAVEKFYGTCLCPGSRIILRSRVLNLPERKLR
jgi:hypothetical protein